MTPRQGAVLQFIAACHHNEAPAPTVRDLVEALGLAPSSVNAVRQHLLGLRDAGLVTWDEGKARTLRLTDQGWAEVGG